MLVWVPAIQYGKLYVRKEMATMVPGTGENTFVLVDESFCISTNPTSSDYPTTVTVYVDGGDEVALVFPDEDSVAKVHHMLGYLLSR